MPVKGEEVGVLVAQGEFEPLAVVEEVATEGDDPAVEVGGSCGGAEITPFEKRFFGKRKFAGEPFEEFKRLKVEVVGDHQNPGMPIMPPPPMSRAMSNHLRVSYLAQMSPTRPSVAPPALSIVSLVPFMA